MPTFIKTVTPNYRPRSHDMSGGAKIVAIVKPIRERLRLRVLRPTRRAIVIRIVSMLQRGRSREVSNPNFCQRAPFPKRT